MEHFFADPGVRLKLLMLALLLFVLFKPIKDVLLGLRSKHWRRVKATITTSGLDRNSGVYCPKIIYTYKINGRELIDDNYTFSGAITNTKMRAIAIVDQNPVGKEIAVYVDPDDAAKTVVVPGVHWSAYANIAFFVVFFSGIAFIVEILNFFFPGCRPNCP